MEQSPVGVWVFSDYFGMCSPVFYRCERKNSRKAEGIEADSEYYNFGGIRDGKTGSVRFLIEIEEIKRYLKKSQRRLK